VAALHSGKEWLLDYGVDAFWAVMRVLACGGLPVLIWIVLTNQLEKKKTVEVKCFKFQL
jgi:zinc transporter 5/7